MMKSKKTILGIVLLIAILLLGIGYAAITDVTLNINGTADATANTDNFIVKFTSATPGDKCTLAEVTSSDPNGRTATMNVSGLQTAGDTATATFVVTNESHDLKAALAVTTQTMGGTNPDYFDVEATIADNTASVLPNGTRTVTVTVTLKETIIADKTATINVQLSATPEEIK